MRAAASRVWVRASRRQSQRVTRRSEPIETDFQPVPSHRGQTSAETFITWVLFLYLDFAPADAFCASAKAGVPVYILCRGRASCGELRKWRVHGRLQHC